MATPELAARTGLESERVAIGNALVRICDEHLVGVDGAVAEAIRYSLAGAGKRLRGALLLAAYRACGGDRDATLLAAAIEVVHAYSLVHDDLPCMDDDDLRRGRPTVHRVYGVAAATAAGVVMVPLAARAAHAAAVELELPAERAGAIVRELVIASGAGGMIGGQLLDLESEGAELSLEALERVHRAKTGALITACAVLGGLAADAGPAEIDALRRYGEGIGLAFQIVDDVLDVVATSDEVGKSTGRDRQRGKRTYPALLGVDGARARGAMLVEEACGALAAAELLTPELDALARYTVTRRS